MCVLMYVDRDRPTENMINRAWDVNDDGGGVAWREGGKVHWKKGITKVGQMHDLLKKLPTPYAAHFRVASCGGVRPELTHPFPVELDSSSAIEGSTEGAVLFHNGDWKGWAEASRLAAIFANQPIPTGKWSDSRAMAWLCSIYGLGFMEFLPEQRGLALSPDRVEFFIGPGWFEINKVWCSNDLFMIRGPRHHPVQANHVYNEGAGHGGGIGGIKYCLFGNCTETKDLDSHGHCLLHRGGVMKPAAALPEARGTQAPIPFLPLRPGEVITVALAQELNSKKHPQTGEKLLSKNLLKKVIAIYADLSFPGKKGEKAKAALQAVSRQLTSSGLVHLILSLTSAGLVLKSF